MKNSFFFHITTINRYKFIVEDIIQKAENFLKNDCLEKFICVNCVNDSISEVKNILDKYQIKNYNLIDNKSNDWEYKTLELLYNFAFKNDRNILYVHSKGVNRIDKNDCVEDWRNYMSYFLIEQYKICIDYLKNNDTVGVDLRATPTLHYSGNFWWAKSDYVKRLCHPRNAPDVINSYRHKNEFWICSELGNHFCAHESGINVYERHLHRFTKEMYAYS